jgi:hypothetical protein
MNGSSYKFLLTELITERRRGEEEEKGVEGD